jgi:hypothetical protein
MGANVTQKMTTLKRHQVCGRSFLGDPAFIGVPRHLGANGTRFLQLGAHLLLSVGANGSGVLAHPKIHAIHESKIAPIRT